MAGLGLKEFKDRSHTLKFAILLQIIQGQGLLPSLNAKVLKIP